MSNFKSVLFPDPLVPTIPIKLPSEISKFILRSLGGVLLLKLKLTYINSYVRKEKSYYFKELELFKIHQISLIKKKSIMRVSF